MCPAVHKVKRFRVQCCRWVLCYMGCATVADMHAVSKRKGRNERDLVTDTY